ncbi:MAG: ATPase [Muribaculaceae bacterium]|jgi:N-acetylglucosamine kinase-like BadF-type ATPase|nr:ATPase [Muribaculaceae bacterium]
MILLADCGSTKVDWRVIEGKNEIKQVTTRGMNAILLTEQEMTDIIKAELVPAITGLDIKEVYFYGAGCLFDYICANVRRAIKANIPSTEKIEVSTDLLAAARALLGDKPGIACIIGTGANSCYYDGEKIAENVSPLGYILGDEGSGAVLGKLLVGDVLKHQLPEHVCQKFLKEYDMNLQKIIEGVYKKPAANRFLASFAPFFQNNMDEPGIHRIILNAFKSFFVRNVENYKDYKKVPVSFVGSVAYHNAAVLREAARPLDITVGKVEKSPMPGLIEYHTK